MSNDNTDIIYSAQHSKVKDFTFDAQVVEVFPDMISRSVPGYATIVDTIGRLSKKYVQDNTRVYDLGCSLGAATLAMRRAVTATGCEIIGVDNSPAMVERCKMHVNAFRGQTPVTIVEADIQETPIENASMVVLNFTMQFIAAEQRAALINKIYQGLVPGGILLISEKVVSEDATCNELLIDLHHDFKRANGYSELEIAQKRTALENVMRPDSVETQHTRLKEAGFAHSTTWFQCFNFLSIIAVK
ncbi:carboxy-S-adenosyl-L-methionine synthase CmoA [Thalassotalea agarivorans]|uniref:Carboxy-S-adenosyl-L-methionine synthase n=1 Tax=Thalassotalea agarivorans TaxID=349064 RepID=A0A1I0GWF8_THASX|nr:carboxy-S-adenosyl-L-methionine synthase CmoA [Thalassotalea agarivorans]SET74860.1 tRNA (cmo5U34)-methyltransferase [Thalassotalea agarivorans]